MKYLNEAADMKTIHVHAFILVKNTIQLYAWICKFATFPFILVMIISEIEVSVKLNW